MFANGVLECMFQSPIPNNYYYLIYYHIISIAHKQPQTFHKGLSISLEKLKNLLDTILLSILTQYPKPVLMKCSGES